MPAPLNTSDEPSDRSNSNVLYVSSEPRTKEKMLEAAKLTMYSPSFGTPKTAPKFPVEPNAGRAAVGPVPAKTAALVPRDAPTASSSKSSKIDAPTGRALQPGVKVTTTAAWAGTASANAPKAHNFFILKTPCSNHNVNFSISLNTTWRPRLTSTLQIQCHKCVW